MPTIRIDQDIYDYLNERGKTADTFNDVLRRELGLSRKSPPKVPFYRNHTEEATDAKMRQFADRHLPPHWAHTPARKKEILMVIEEVLRQPEDWSVADREIAARKTVAKSLGIDSTTVRDKYTRQLYGNGGDQGRRFRDALERIEQDFKTE